MTDKEAPAEPLAILGGTFDPVHYGHLRCGEEVRRKLGLGRLLLLPAGTPPHRPAPGATTRQRLDMLRLAVAEFPELEIDERETQREGPSYMVDTLAGLRSENPGRPLLLLVGQDAANLLHTWYEWRRLFSLAHIVILTRPGAPAAYEEALGQQLRDRLTRQLSDLQTTPAGKVFRIEVESVDVSATRIKRLIRAGGSPDAMLPAAVLNYIREKRLYL